MARHIYEYSIIERYQVYFISAVPSLKLTRHESALGLCYIIFIKLTRQFKNY